MKVSTIRNFIGAAVIGAGAFVMYPPHEKKNIRVRENFPTPISSIECNLNRKNIVIIDNFDTDRERIDYDLKPDVTHGYVVNKIITNGVKDAKIYNYNMPICDNITKENMRNPLKRVINDIDRGRKYAAINLSIGALVSYNDLSNQTQIELTPENIKSKKKELKQNLRNLKEPNISGVTGTIDAESMMDFINDLDTISSKGTKIYVAAGNSFDEAFNILALVDSAVVVGALSDDGTKQLYTSDNSLVNRWEKDKLEIEKVDGGYSFTNGQEPDVKSYETTGIFNWPSILGLRGTSYSTPRALVKDLNK